MTAAQGRKLPGAGVSLVRFRMFWVGTRGGEEGDTVWKLRAGKRDTRQREERQTDKIWEDIERQRETENTDRKRETHRNKDKITESQSQGQNTPEKKRRSMLQDFVNSVGLSCALQAWLSRLIMSEAHHSCRWRSYTDKRPLPPKAAKARTDKCTTHDNSLKNGRPVYHAAACKDEHRP